MSTKKEAKIDKSMCNTDKNTTPGVLLYGDRERGNYAAERGEHARKQATSA